MRDITKEDYGYDKNSYYSYNKNGYYKAKRLTTEQIEKFVKAKQLIGYEIHVFYKSKNRKCIIVAVSLPDDEETVYCSECGLKLKYRSYPYDIRICIEEGLLQEVWYNNIDNYNLDNPIYEGVYFEGIGCNHKILTN